MDDSVLLQKIDSLFTNEEDLSDSEKTNASILIHNVFRFLEKDARDIMKHRSHIIAIDMEETVEDALNFMLEHHFTRYPVYKEDIDDIRGFVVLRDIVRCYMDLSKRKLKLEEVADFIRPVTFIPETRHIDRLFRTMQKRQLHLVIVLDEYGQTIGLVTIEDIIEEIVGNILDEHQKENKLIESLGNHTFIADGFLSLDDLENKLQIKFETDEFNSLNGFIVNQLEHIPTTEEKAVIEYEGYRFQVLLVDNNMIRRVRIEKKSE